MLPVTILITGASSGLGAALARQYARNGVTLGLLGRSAVRLAYVADICRQQGARVEIFTGDITESASLGQWIESFDDRHRIDLCIANAGISAGSGGGGETLEQAKHIFNVNLFGVMNTIHPVIDRMMTRKNGHIAIVSSLAGFRGLPTTPAYSASKAAVRIYGQALNGLLHNHGIAVTTICPGFIKTPMTDVNPFPMPMMMSAEQAAKIISHRLHRRPSMIAFPWPMALLAKLQNMVPDTILNRIYSHLPGKPSQ